ncbi:MAG: radical SAM protein, partial [Arhodomonas sp.]|nr:radical SAM protein [Arhodomonas sp.]
MPEEPEWLPKSEFLTFEELERVARLFIQRLGIDSIRLTGGEPLVRRGVPDFVARLDALRGLGLRRISMTSNGVPLARSAAALAAAGLDDINISIDSLDPERFRRMTGGGDLAAVLEGIRAARDAGLGLKLNAVVIRGDNEDDVVPSPNGPWARGSPSLHRFITQCPWRLAAQRVVPEREIIEHLEQRHEVEPVSRTREPATYYRVDGAYHLGVISTVSNPFCSTCDRVRVTATGEIYPCLFSPVNTDLKTPLRDGADDDELE